MSIWHSLLTPFDAKLPRRTAVLIKENTETTAYYYPLDFGRIGYSLDTRKNSTYEEKPAFNFYIDEYGLGDLGNNPTATRLPFFFKSMENAPNYVRRDIVFANYGLDLHEQIASPLDTGITWDLTFRQRTLHRKSNRRLFLVFTADGKWLNVEDMGKTGAAGQLFTLLNDDGQNLWVALGTAVDYGLYNTFDDYRDAIFKGSLNGQSGRGRYFLVAIDVAFDRVKYSSEFTERQFVMGLSSMGADQAQQNLIDHVEEATATLWNKWLDRVPAPDFPNDDVKKAYYKSWAVIKQNYYRHESWGHIVLEALPVYKGVWTWGTSALPFNSLLDPEHPGEFARNALNLFCENIREDGFIPHAIYIDEKVPGESWSKGRGVIQTPHFPWVALEYYKKMGDLDSLRKWYNPFRSYYQFICRSRDEALENLHLWAALTSFDTGLDVTCVLTDITYYDEPYTYPAIFAAERIRYERTMAEIATILGIDDEAASWLAEADVTLAAAQKVLWDPKKHWFGVKHADGTLETVVGVDGLFMLGYGFVSCEQAELMRPNVEKLIRRYGIVTVAPDEPKQEPNFYWRGAAWPKSCAIGTYAVCNYYPDLKGKVLESLTRWALQWPSIWECLNGENGDVAGADVGVLATPFISSNVGAGEFIGALRRLLQSSECHCSCSDCH